MGHGRSWIGSLAVAAVLATPAVAAAAPGHPGEPLATVPSIRVEPGFGPIGWPSVSTTSNGDAGAPAGCGDAEGAAAFKADLDEPAHLSLTVAELDPNGLCGVGIYRSGVGSIYDVAGRVPHTILEQVCAATCSIETRLEPGVSYIVVWPRGTGSAGRDVSLSGSLRGFPVIDARLSGADVGSCRRIERGATALLRYDVAPTPTDDADRIVTVSRIDRRTGAVVALGDHPLGPDGAGSLELAGVPRGYHDVIVAFDGSPSRTPRQRRVCLVVRGPSKLEVRPRGERYRYDDYAVWRAGDRMVFRLPVFPWPPGANGEIAVRIERNIGNHRYMDWEVRRDIPVRDGLGVLRMRARYRANGFPFYRMRTEWPGSNTHAAGKSPWICFQVNP